ncbi:MAG: hypothetical protein ABI351_04770 [Herbaspirillum sp.]
MLTDPALESETATPDAVRSQYLRCTERSTGAYLTSYHRPYRQVLGLQASARIHWRVHGSLSGHGYIKTGSTARLCREAPLNSVWEVSGNMMCLGVLCAIEHETEGFRLLLDQPESTAADHSSLQQLVDDLRREFNTPPEQRRRSAHRLVQRLLVAVQVSLMLQ